MREIKFELIYKEGESTSAEVVTIDEFISGDFMGSHHNLIAKRQFTGLHDSNSKEIYDRDIVSDHVGIGLVKYSEKHGAFRVCYGDGLAKWFYDYILKGEIESIEVIGNVYENTELLEYAK